MKIKIQGKNVPHNNNKYQSFESAGVAFVKGVNDGINNMTKQINTYARLARMNMLNTFCWCI